MVTFQRRVLAERLQIAPVEGLGEGAHLRAGVVDVVFALDLPTGRGQHARQGVAQHGVARRAHVQRPGRVGADELHLARLAAAQIDVAVAALGSLDRSHLAGQPRVAQTEIDEAGRRHLDRGDEVRGRQMGSDHLGDCQRRHARGLGRLHGRGAGEVAPGSFLGPADFDRRRVERRQRAGGLGVLDGLCDEVSDLVANHCEYFSYFIEVRQLRAILRIAHPNTLPCDVIRCDLTHMNLYVSSRSITNPAAYPSLMCSRLIAQGRHPSKQLA